MVKRNSVAGTSRNSTREEAQLLEFTNSNEPPEALEQRAIPLLNNKDLPRIVLALTLQKQAVFIEKVYQVYLTLSPQNARYIVALGEVCSATLQLPASAVLSSGLDKRGNIAVASGGLTDIWRGELGGVPVAIKAFRIYPAQSLKEAKEVLWKRVPLWLRLSHPNILPFRGVNTTLFQLCLVYDWGQYGNITQYLDSHPAASRPSLLLDVAKGLEYLHSLDIPHGDLKGANVVIDRKGRARLTEYGLAPIISDPSFTVAATPGAVGTSRWLAPEIITPVRKGSPMPAVESKAADVFAFGMFAVEVFTGKIPFEQQRNETAVLRISQGGRPEMPSNGQAVGLTVGMWDILQGCWQENPRKRPTMGEVVRRWQGLVTNGGDLNVFPEGPRHGEIRRDGTGRRRLNTEATRPRTKAEPPRNRTISEAGGSRAKPHTGRFRTSSIAEKGGLGLGEIPQSPDSDVTRRNPQPEVTKERTKAENFQPVYETPPTTKGSRGCCIIM